MKKNYKHIIVVLLAINFCAGCKKDTRGQDIDPPDVPELSVIKSWLVDKNATDQTAAMFYNMKTLAKTKIMFGHQDDTKRGVINQSAQWAREQHLPPVSGNKSDVKEVTGSFPAVYGHDFLHIADFASGIWFDYEKQVAHDLTVEAYERGGINTYAWHYANPVSKGSFYWADSPVDAVTEILPGGSHHDVYKNSLQEVATFAKSLIASDGKLVPVIFRPFHEMDGDWFWWGAAHCTPGEYRQLYQFTVTYLRDALGVRNFLYGWSPDKNFFSQAQYLERYPGDDYVDLIGMDNYGDMVVGTPVNVAANKLKIVSDLAKSKNKIAAMTETGLHNLTQADWFTKKLFAVLVAQPIELSYVLVWANTTAAYWTPYKGHVAENDFIQFKNNNYMVFGDNLPAMYKLH